MPTQPILYISENAPSYRADVKPMWNTPILVCVPVTNYVLNKSRLHHRTHLVHCNRRAWYIFLDIAPQLITQSSRFWLKRMKHNFDNCYWIVHVRKTSITELYPSLSILDFFSVWFDNGIFQSVTNSILMIYAADDYYHWNSTSFTDTILTQSNNLDENLKIRQT